MERYLRDITNDGEHLTIWRGKGNYFLASNLPSV